MPNNTGNTTTDTITIEAGNTFTWNPLFEPVPPIKMEDTPAPEEKDVYYAFTTEKYRDKSQSIHKKWFGAVFRKVYSHDNVPDDNVPGSIKLEIISWGPLWTAEEEAKNPPYGDKIGDEIWLDKFYVTIME